jgi:hypothetical protein
VYTTPGSSSSSSTSTPNHPLQQTAVPFSLPQIRRSLDPRRR